MLKLSFVTTKFFRNIIDWLRPFVTSSILKQNLKMFLEQGKILQ